MSDISLVFLKLIFGVLLFKWVGSFFVNAYYKVFRKGKGPGSQKKNQEVFDSERILGALIIVALVYIFMALGFK